jgi:hypothetical protein
MITVESVVGMVEIADLRNAANRMRRRAAEIRLDSVPAPYYNSNEDTEALEKIASLLDEAADEILRLRAPQSK